MDQLTFLAGKIILGLYFIVKGLNTVYNPKTSYRRRMPYPKPISYISTLLLLAGGIMIILGAYPVVALTLLSAYLLAVNIGLHDFWNMEEDRRVEMNLFMKNAALIGAMLMLMRADWTIYGLGLSIGVI